LLLELFCEVETPKPGSLELIVEHSNTCLVEVASHLGDIWPIFSSEAQRDFVLFPRRCSGFHHGNEVYCSPPVSATEPGGRLDP
jgi:hypothetical protein